jgi:phage shock protein C
MANTKRLYRSKNNRMISGVCGGLGEFFSIDPTVVRLIFVLGTVFGLGSLLVAYIVLMIVVPEEPGAYSATTPPTYPPAASPVEPVDVEPGDESPSI